MIIINTTGENTSFQSARFKQATISTADEDFDGVILDIVDEDGHLALEWTADDVRQVRRLSEILEVCVP